MARRGGNGDAFFPPWVRVVRDIGFPIAVAAYLLWSVVPAIEGLRRAISVQTRTFVELARDLDESMDITDDTNHRLQQMMGDAPWRAQTRRSDRARRERERERTRGLSDPLTEGLGE